MNRFDKPQLSEPVRSGWKDYVFIQSTGRFHRMATDRERRCELIWTAVASLACFVLCRFAKTQLPPSLKKYLP